MWPTATLFVALVVGGCGGDDPPLECNTQVSAACAPLYPPTFENVYSMTLVPKCGSGARSCHSDSGMKGGMTFSTIDNAYAALLEPGQDRVIPGDPSCSVMIIRTHSLDFSIKMPPGSSLQAPELCALVQWVANGAERTPGVPDAAPDASPADASIDATIDATIVGVVP
jgi:hypothetical protein